MRVKSIYGVLAGVILIGIAGIVVFLKPQYRAPETGNSVSHQEEAVVASRLKANSFQPRSSRQPMQITSQQTVVGKSYVVHEPGSKPTPTTITVDNQEIYLHEGENRLYLFRNGVELPRPLTDAERERLEELRLLLLDSTIPIEKRLVYAEQSQQILKNTRPPRYQEVTFTIGSLPPQLMDLPPEERRKMIQARNQEFRARLEQRAQALRVQMAQSNREFDENEPSMPPTTNDESRDSLVTPDGDTHVLPSNTPPSDSWLDNDMLEAELLRQIESALGLETPETRESHTRSDGAPVPPMFDPNELTPPLPPDPHMIERENRVDKPSPPVQVMPSSRE